MVKVVINDDDTHKVTRHSLNCVAKRILGVFDKYSHKENIEWEIVNSIIEMSKVRNWWLK